MTTDRSRSISRIAALWLAGAIVWCLLAIGLVGFFWYRSAATVSNGDAATWVPVRENSTPVDRNIDLSIDWLPAQSVYAPAWNGVTTGTAISVGSTITSGTVVASIDDIDRIAINTPRPFFRPIASGDSGADVQMLNQVLASLGFAADKDSDKYTRSTGQSVSKLAAKLGVPRVDSVAAFDPAWFVYLPAASLVVKESNIEVGAPAPAPGTSVLVGAGAIGTVKLIERIDESAPSSVGEDQSASPSPGVAETPETILPPSSTVVATADEQLIVGGRTFELAEDRSSVAASALPGLQGVVDGSARVVAAVLRSAPGGDSWVVPSASVVQGDKSVCVMIEGTKGEGASAVTVNVIGSRVGVSVVEGALSASTRVLVAPASRLRACPTD